MRGIQNGATQTVRGGREASRGMGGFFKKIGKRYQVGRNETGQKLREQAAQKRDNNQNLRKGLLEHQNQLLDRTKTGQNHIHRLSKQENDFKQAQKSNKNAHKDFVSSAHQISKEIERRSPEATKKARNLFFKHQEQLSKSMSVKDFEIYAEEVKNHEADAASILNIFQEAIENLQDNQTALKQNRLNTKQERKAIQSAVKKDSKEFIQIEKLKQHGKGAFENPKPRFKGLQQVVGGLRNVINPKQRPLSGSSRTRQTPTAPPEEEDRFGSLPPYDKIANIPRLPSITKLPQPQNHPSSDFSMWEHYDPTPALTPERAPSYTQTLYPDLSKEVAEMKRQKASKKPVPKPRQSSIPPRSTSLLAPIPKPRVSKMHKS